MLVKDLKSCPQFVAGDRSLIREVLHPKNDGIESGFSLAHATVKKGGKTVPHRLKKSVEVYYILQGEGLMHINNEVKIVRENQAVFIPPNSLQWIENTGNKDLVFLCVVSPPWSEEDEEVLEGEI